MTAPAISREVPVRHVGWQLGSRGKRTIVELAMVAMTAAALLGGIRYHTTQGGEALQKCEFGCEGSANHMFGSTLDAGRR